MKGKVLCFLGMITLLICSGRAYGWEWLKEVRGNSLAGNMQKVAMKTDTMGNMYIAGTFTGANDFDPSSSVRLLESTSMGSIFFAKYDALGNVAFAKCLEGFYLGHCDAIALDNHSNIYITGRFGGTVDFDPSMGVASRSSASTLVPSDAYIAKYDASGNFVYAINMPGNANGTPSDFCITVDTDGNAYISGRFWDSLDFDPGQGITRLTGSGFTSFFAKYDTVGNLIYAKKWDPPAATMGLDWIIPNGIVIDPAGDILMTGQLFGTMDFDPGTGNSPVSSSGNADIFLAKYDATGNYVFAKAIGGASYDEGRSLTTDGAGNIYVTGLFRENNINFNPGGTAISLNSNGDADVFFAKYDAQGICLFAKNVGGTGVDQGLSIATNGTGDIYVTGTFGSSGGDFDPGTGVVNLSGITYDANVFFARYDASGNYVFARAITPTRSVPFIRSIISLDGSGNIYLSGSFQGEADFDPGTNTVNLFAGTSTDNNVSNVYIAKYNGNGGAYIWAGRIGGYSNAGDQVVPYSIKSDAAGNSYIVGAFCGTVDFGPGPIRLTSQGGNLNLYDGFFAKYDPSGNCVYAKNIGGAGAHVRAVSITIDSIGNVYIGGTFNGKVDFDPGLSISDLSSASVSRYDIFFAKYDPSGNYVYAKRMGGTSDDGGGWSSPNVNVVSDKAGNLYVTGSFQSTVDFDPGVGVANLVAVGSDIFFAKYDPSGSYVYAKRITGSGSEVPTALDIDAAGNVYVAGRFGTGAVKYDAVNTSTLTSGHFLAKYNGTGDYVYGIDFLRNSAYFHLAVDQSGNAYIGGNLPDSMDFDPGPNIAMLVSSDDIDVFWAKYDPAGNYVYARCAGGEGRQLLSGGLKVDDIGNVYLAGTFSITSSFGPHTYLSKSVQTSNTFIAKYDSSGVYVASESLIGSGVGIAGLSKDDPGNIYVVGAYSYILEYGDTFLYSGRLGAAFVAKYGMSDCNNTAAIITPASPLNVCTGDSVILTVVVAGIHSYTWLQDGSVISGAGDSFYVAVTAGDYRVIISNGSNCIDTSDAVTVTELPLPAPVIAESGGVLTTGTFDTYQWYINGTLIPGATSQTYTPIIGGNYTVAVTDGNGCAGTSVVFPYLNTDHVEETGVISRQVKVYPNPVRDIIYITAPVVLSAVVTSIEGKIVLQPGVTTAIDVTNLPNGMYILQLTDESGRVIKTEKLSKTGND